MAKDLNTICLVWPYFGLQYYDRYLSIKKELRGLANVVVIVLSDRSATYPFWKDTFPDVEYCFHDKEWESIETMSLYKAVYAKLREIKPIAVFSHSYSTIDARACLAYCFAGSARLCIMTDSKADDFKRVWWKEYIKRFIIQGADGMLVPNTPSVDYYRQIGFKGPIYIGYNAISPSTVLDRVCPEKISQIKNNIGPFLICIARPLSRKCVPELIAVWRQVAKGDIKLLVLGGDQSQYGIAASKDVLFVGQTSQQDTYNYIAASDGLILPSSQDQWGNVVAEALVLGKRVIVSDGCGVSSIITDKSYGYTFKKNDWSGLQAVLEEFLKGEYAACTERMPLPIRMDSFVLSVQTFIVDSYRGSKPAKLFARLLLKLIFFVYPHKTYL
jgi:glycosyltransferase involved in cell wall biosynthesis